MPHLESGVYAFKNTATGKSYVGSSVDLERRRRAHIRELTAGVHKSAKLQNSWNAHGPGAFEYAVLEFAPRDEGPLRAAEQKWIDALDAVANGYNANPVAGNVGRLPKTPEHKARIGAAHVGRKNSEESKQRMREAAVGRPSRPATERQKARTAMANVGKVRTPEMRAQLSAARKGLKVGPHSPGHCAAISAGKRGKPLSEHHKQRIRDGQAASRAAKALA